MTRPHFAPWDDRTLPRILSAEEAARRLRQFVEIERRLATLLEKWAAAVDDAGASALFSQQARLHSWHGDLFEDRFSDSTEPGDGTVEDEHVASFLQALEEPPGGDLLGFLVGVYRVLIPRKVTAYTYFVRALGSSADANDDRWMEFILQDEYSCMRDGEIALQRLVNTPELAQRAAQRRAELERHLVASGGLVGPDTLGLSHKETANT